MVGSVVGFVLYYYVLRQVQASRVALIALMTPVIALILGQWLNEEIIGAREWLGTLIILAGLAVFEWGGQWQRLLPARGREQIATAGADAKPALRYRPGETRGLTRSRFRVRRRPRPVGVGEHPRR